jgi:hypothetical protein
MCALAGSDVQLVHGVVEFPLTQIRWFFFLCELVEEKTDLLRTST